ncbi:hypothetical protein D9M71_774590 [compost metagenome]
MISPIDHINRSVKQPVFHFKTKRIIFVMAGVKKNRVSVNHWCRVGSEFGLNDRILAKTNLEKP